MLIQAKSTILLPRNMDIRPREIAFPNGWSYGGGGRPGVFDDELVIGKFSDAEAAEARAMIQRAIAKGGAYPVGAAETVIDRTWDDGVIVITDDDGRARKVPSRTSRRAASSPAEVVDIVEKPVGTIII